MRASWKRIWPVVALIFLVTCGTGIVRSAQSPPRQPVRLVCLPGVPLPVVIGKAQGIFDRFGIEVSTEKAANAIALREALGNQSADIAHSSVENAVEAAASSGIDDVIVMGGEGSTSELIVQPEIKSVKDLRGHIIILDGLDTAYTLTLKKILLLNGIKPGSDCELKVIGLAPDRLAAMREHKEYSATIQKPPTSMLSERAGLVSLGTTQDLLGMGPFQGIGAFVLRSWAAAHSDLLERYIAAFVESQRWLMNPANKQQVVEMMMKESHLPQDIADETYSADVKSGWTPDARFQTDGFRNVLALRDEFNPPAAQRPSPEKYYDLSYYQNALQLLQRQN
ncbi:MAG: ABC transporter substrate-binding protein [Candidatus Acidiferrales bacterium]